MAAAANIFREFMAAKLKPLLEEYMKYNNNETRYKLESMIIQIGWTIKGNQYKSPLGTFSSNHLFEVAQYLLKELQNGVRLEKVIVVPHLEDPDTEEEEDTTPSSL